LQLRALPLTDKLNSSVSEIPHAPAYIATPPGQANGGEAKPDSLHVAAEMHYDPLRV
jgi:hypothetical protein